jgi:hypothetical protein
MASCGIATPLPTLQIEKTEKVTASITVKWETQYKTLSPVFTESLSSTLTPTFTVTETSFPESTATIIETQSPTAGPTTKWIEYWDARYHYGLAIPCHWTVYPTSMEGIQAALVIMNYDEQFVKEHTDKGNWIDDWELKTIKIDFIVFENIDSTLGTDEALHQILDKDTQSVLSTEERIFGSHTAIIALLRDTERPESHGQIVAFRIALDKILLIAVYPSGSWETTDVQGILESFAFTEQEKIVIPNIPPITPIITIQESCKK